MATLDKILWTILGLAIVFGRLVCLPFLVVYVAGVGLWSAYQLWDAGAFTKEAAKAAGMDDTGDWGVLLVRAVMEIRTGEFNAEPTAENYRERAMQLAAQARFKAATSSRRGPGAGC
jgi:hypothetical protein